MKVKVGDRVETEGTYCEIDLNGQFGVVVGFSMIFGFPMIRFDNTFHEAMHKGYETAIHPEYIQDVITQNHLFVPKENIKRILPPQKETDPAKITLMDFAERQRAVLNEYGRGSRVCFGMACPDCPFHDKYHSSCTKANPDNLPWVIETLLKEEAKLEEKSKAEEVEEITIEEIEKRLGKKVKIIKGDI